MKRLSPNLDTEPLEIRNTGLRPNWNGFWALDTSSTELEGETMMTRITASFLSSKSGMSGGTFATGGGIRHVRFITGSEWIGEWDRTGMNGMGMYKMPHGVIYEGTMKNGLFEGVGVLKYPNGSFLEGLWYQGKLKYWQYDYADGLERDCHDWKYCTAPDRRFFSEHITGFRPACTEQLTNDHPPREVPPGHYDVGQGFYNPKSYCVVDAITGEVISIPTIEERKWILDRCRTSEPTETVGFRPDLYENWYQKSALEENPSVGSSGRIDEVVSEPEWLRAGTHDSKNLPGDGHLGWSDITKSGTVQESESALRTAEKEILNLLKQEGEMLHPMTTTYSSHRKYSLHEKMELEQGQEQSRVASFEGLLKKLMREIESQKQSGKTSDDSGRKIDTISSNESNLTKLTQLISYAESASRKKPTLSPLGSGGALEQFKMIGKLIPSFSLTTAKHFPYSNPSPEKTVDSFLHKVDTNECNSEEKKSKTEEESIIVNTNYLIDDQVNLTD